MKITKMSDYKVVDQLSQTPSKIYMLSLLLSSVADIESLLKIQNEAHITKDIIVDQFDGVVILSASALTYHSNIKDYQTHIDKM